MIVHEPSRDCYEHSLLMMMQSVGACVTQLKRQRCKRQRLLLGHSHGHALRGRPHGHHFSLKCKVQSRTSQKVKSRLSIGLL